MRIVGIDPGLHATGYGVIAVSSGGLRVVAAGAVRPSPRRSLASRLGELYDGLRHVVAAHRPQVMALESVYTHHAYLTTASLMAHARGVICLLGAQQGMALVEYLPTRVKKALTGRGHASKEQVARAVEMWLNVDATSWASDVTDALALAIAHAHIAVSDTKRKMVSDTAAVRRRLPAALAEALK